MSITAIFCPGCSVGTKKRSTEASNTKAFVFEASKAIAAYPIAPSRVMLAISVVFEARFLGTLPYALSPLSALAYQDVSWRCVSRTRLPTQKG